MSETKTIYVKDNIRTVVQGSNLILSVGVTHNSFVNSANDNTLHYLWTKDGIPFGTEEGDLAYHDYKRPRSWWDRPSIELNDIRVDDAGIYQCEISNQFGTVTSEPTTVEVLDVLENNLLTKNIVQNGEQRLGDAGWSVIEGSMEQVAPYFWDSNKKLGWVSTWDMSPSTRHIIDQEIYPKPDKGDRVLGPFANRNLHNEIKLHQEIDLTQIKDVIDRKIEGIEEVDLRCGAWLVGKRFHVHDTHCYTKIDDDGDVNWRRGIASDDSSHERNDHPAFWHIKQAFINDMIRINFILFNDRDDEIRRVQLSNTRNSYQRTLMCFKHRRIGMPIGARKLRVELVAHRDGSRAWDRSMNDIRFKSILTGCWGINARIIVNRLGDDFNRQYETWEMPRRAALNPAVLKYKFTEWSQLEEWNERATWGNGSMGAVRDTAYPLSTWVGSVKDFYRWPNEEEGIRNKHICFNIYRPNTGIEPESSWDHNLPWSSWVGYSKTSKTSRPDMDDAEDIYFGKPIMVRHAAMAALNVKRMNLEWLKDFNNNQMDRDGKSAIYFQFSIPALTRDQEDLSSVMTKRRILVMAGANIIPVIRQKLLYEDIDDAIYEVHKNTDNFKPHLNKLETMQGAWSFEDGDYTFLKRPIYDVFKQITHSGISGTQHWSDFDDFLNDPSDNYVLPNMYWGLCGLYWFMMDYNPQDISITGISEDDISEIKVTLEDTMNWNKIYQILQAQTQVPEEVFSAKEEQIKNMIKQRLTFHLLDCAFRAMLERMKSEEYSGHYKDARNYGHSKAVTESPRNNFGYSPD
tara:strand:- start:34587 stop:36983 length:2397 start_codon:yes stop_codon:yes gene_type:complete